MKADARSIKLLGDMLKAAKAIAKNSEGLSMAELAQDELRRKAVERDFIILGEAAKRLCDSHDFQTRFPEVAWDKVIGLRNIIVHEYDELIYDLMEGVIANRIPELIGQLVHAGKNLDQDG